MKIKKNSQRKKSKKIIVLLIILTITLFGAGFILAEKLNLFGENSPTNESSGELERDKTKEKEKQPEQSNPSEKEPDGDNKTEKEKFKKDLNDDDTKSPKEGKKSNVPMIISSLNQTNDTLSIRTMIQHVTSSGRCTLSIEYLGANLAKMLTRESEVHALPSSSTCKGFDLPMSKLFKGKWRLIIHFEDDKAEATIEKEITIK